MPFEVVMPRLGWNMESGAVSAWRKRDGEPVAAGEILMEIESEKAVQEVEALESGILLIPPQSPALGVQVPVGTLLAWLLGPGDRLPGPRAAAPRDAAPAQRVSPAPPTAAGPVPAPAPLAPPSPPPAPSQGRASISPRARRAASALGVDWAKLSGTGSSGRIRERDVRAAAAPARSIAAAAAMPASPAPSAAVLAVEADATDLDWLLREIGRGGADPAPTPGEFIVKAAAHALASLPADVSIALGVEGVHPPLVLPDPRPLSILRFARESRELLAQARAGRLDPAEAGGAMLVVRDLGALGVDAYTPAVEASARAVLGIGRIVAKEVVTDPEAGRLAVRRTVALTLVLDPRAADAVVGARFLRKLAWFVAHPIGLLVGP